MAEIQDVMDKLGEIETKMGEMETKIGEVEIAVNADRMVYSTCAHCNAIGMVGGDPSNCTVCGGTGFRAHGKIGKV